MSERDKSDMSKEKGIYSPYFIGRHKKAVLGALATTGAVVAGLLSYVNHNQNVDAAAAGLQALKRDKACERVIDTLAGPNAQTATVRLASLSAQQKDDCRLNKFSSTVVLQSGYDAVELDATLVDPSVTLPDRQSLQAAAASDLAESNTGEWSDLPFDIGMGGLAVPAVLFMVTAALSGDFNTYNERQSAAEAARAARRRPPAGEL